MFSPPVRLALLPALFITASALGQGITPSPTPADTPAPVMADLAPAGTTISGVVMSDKEENNEGLPGALVSAINLTTGTQITVPTNGEGRFELKNLQPGGPYIVQVRQEGFRPLSVTNIYLTAGRDTPLTLTLTTETVAVGTRRADRGALESAVPVDVIDMAAQAQRAPGTDATQLLNYAVPSFNATRQTNAGGADFVELGSLRGLGTDQLLVLVNGKRRHTTALLGLLGNRGVGTVGTDLNTLPSNAIDRVEILRDGAAAQYGSDAIAGVMNIALKSNNHGGTVLASAGLTSQGDGFASSLSVSKGLKLGENGFLSITAGADQRQPTTRGYARNGVSSPVFSFDPATEVLALARAGKTYADYTQRNGDARTNNYRLLLNASAQATSKLKIYGFGGYNYRTGQAQAPWVLPATQPQNIVSAIFPNGYAPLINTRIHDASGAVGAVYDLGGYSLDVSHTVGYNQMRYDVENTLKPSDDKLTATAFQAGGYQFTQNVTNVTLNHLYSKVLAGTNVALGGELRTDQYAIVEGELNSYGYSGDINPAAAAGSQGFTGFSDASAEASKGSRRNVGAFLDVEADVTKKWLVSTALRFENYTDFGSAFIYKATTRYQVARQVAVRGAFNTGFRAPSLQQVLYRQTISSQGISSGIFNNLDEVTKAAGIEPLEAEKSRSYSAGLVLTPAAGLTFTADGYLIDIDNRLLLTGLLTGQAPVMPGGNGDALYNVLRTKSVSGARFFHQWGRYPHPGHRPGGPLHPQPEPGHPHGERRGQLHPHHCGAGDCATAF